MASNRPHDGISQSSGGKILSQDELDELKAQRLKMIERLSMLNGETRESMKLVGDEGSGASVMDLQAEEAVPQLKAGKDLHWDYVLKEMKWLAEDFQKERQRHIGNGKKLSKSVDLWHKSKETKKFQKKKE